MKKIPLTQGQFALVDDRDFERLNQFKWYAQKDRHTFYAKRNIPVGKKRTIVYMHRFLMQPTDNMQVDHRDGNGLNNQRHNLRVCTHAENQQNQRSRGGTSSYKGVYWHKRDKKWMAQIRHNGKNINLGYYTDETEAAKAYDAKATDLFGEHAYSNFPNEGSVCDC